MKISLNLKVLIGFILLVSFFLFSLYFNQNLSSDDALNVLMAFDYSLPHDIYCWGQDRGGSFIPLISQPLIRLFNISPLLAVSISNYFVLFLGFIGFSKLFKNQFTIILFALLWFFPYERFNYINTFPIGMSYSLIGFSILFILKLFKPKDTKNRYSELLNVSIILTLWGLAVWVSDLAFVTIFILITGLIINYHLKKPPFFSIKKFYLAIGIGIPSIIGLIFFCKSFSTGITEQYQNFNSLQEIYSGVKIVYYDCLKVLSFNAKESFVSIGAWILVLLLIGVTYLVVKNAKQILSFENVWITIFLTDLIVILFIIFLSHWVFLNNMGRWYFVSTYISFILLLLLFLDSKFEKLTKVNKISILSITILLSLSSISTPIIKSKGNYKPMSSTLSELNQLGEIGIIADYWDAYRCSMVNPAQIKSTPHEGSDIKNPDRVSEVFSQPRIFLSRDMWFDTFPDSISQFGVMLYKYKKEFLLGGSNICEYKLHPFRKEYQLKDLKFDTSVMDSTLNCLTADKMNSNVINKHLVYGQDATLIPGKYRIRYYCSSAGKPSDSKPITIDISSNYGQNILLWKEVEHKELFNKTGYIEVILDTPTLSQHVEFRLVYNGFEKVSLSKIEVKQL